MIKSVLAAVAALTIGSTAGAATVTDTTGTTSGGDRCMACSTNIGIGQTWLSTVTGDVLSMEVYLTPLFGTSPGDLALSVFDYATDTLLARTTVSRSAFAPPGSGDQSVVVDFSTLGLSVAAGTEYALEVVAGEDNPFAWQRTGVSSYPGVWYDIDDSGRGTPSTFQDFRLDVNVDVAAVPIPASMSLMVAGLGGLAALRRKA